MIASEPGTPLKIHAELDLRGVICPYNYVKTKLKLERMTEGEILAVILDNGEPMQNVPRSVTDDGHRILRIDPFGPAFRVLIERGEPPARSW